MAEKWCFRCQRMLPDSRDFFYSDRSKLDGLSSYCQQCVRDHGKEHYRKNLTKYAAASKAYRESHPEVGAYIKEYQRVNRDALVAKMREYRTAHLEEERANKRLWRKLNPEKSRILRARDKATRKARQANVFSEPVDYREIYDSLGGVCGICFSTVAWDQVSWDHIVPVAKQGPNAWFNLQPAHQLCNGIKGERSLEWAQGRIAELRYYGKWEEQ